MGNKYQEALRAGTRNRGALLAAMVIPILIITGFQAYWIRDNYRREKNVTEVKAYSLFRETVRSVQDSIVREKLNWLIKDTSSRAGLTPSLDSGTIRRRAPALTGTVRVLNILSEGRNIDTAENRSPGRRKNMIISLHERDTNSRRRIDRRKVLLDSAHEERMLEGRFFDFETSEGPLRRKMVSSDSINTQPGKRPVELSGRINTILIHDDRTEGISISIDSLFRDTIPLAHLENVFSKSLQGQKMILPFTLTYNPGSMTLNDRVVIRAMEANSFAGYSVVLGNIFPFLIRRISLPILFSLFLVALTIASFVLLYRNILRQQKLAAIKSDLVNNITHELKTPIATVNVAIEALQKFNALKDTGKTEEYLSISRNELQRLELLVDKVLKLSMFENREIELNYEHIDIGMLIRDVIGSMRLQIERQNGKIHFKDPGGVIIRGDRLHLQSVVFNLLDNAVKYSNDLVDIQVELERLTDTLVLRVKDKGIGIPVNYQDKVFEKFFRVPAGNTHNAKGHGLGLSYAAEVVRQHQGTIRLESEEGRGTEFIIQLPLTLKNT
jgi:two-component system phosphate regulon sensor histidine kinase PhoR